MTLGADITLNDSNGCTITHWAAYKNSVYLLKSLKSLG